MMRPLVLAALAVLLALAAPARARDDVLGPARLDSATGALTLPGGPVLGSFVGGAYTATPQRLVLPGTDQGSSGDVSGFSVKTPGVPGGQPLRTWLSTPIFAALSAGRASLDPLGLASALGDRGDRGPLFIWNNPNGATPAGRNGGLQIWVGDNPTATPGAGDTVGLTTVVVNGNNRTRLYGANIFTQVCNAIVCGPGYVDAKATALELEVGTGYPGTPTDPWGPGSRKIGLELTAQSGSASRPTAAIMTWANDNSSVGWWNTGIALSRVFDVGILAQSNPNGTTPGTGPFNADGIRAFQGAFLYDLSDSAAVLKVGPGTHAAVIDLSNAVTPGYLVRGRPDRDSGAVIGNGADFAMSLTLDSGVSAAKGASLQFSDRSTPKWAVGKGADNALRITDLVGGTAPLTIAPSTGTVTLLNAAVAGTLVVPFGTPASASAPCTQGQIMIDATYSYACVAPSTWRRTSVGAAW